METERLHAVESGLTLCLFRGTDNMYVMYTYHILYFAYHLY